MRSSSIDRTDSWTGGLAALVGGALGRRVLGAAAGLMIAVGLCTSAAAAPSAPDFELKDLSGTTVRLSSFRGQTPVLLVFWATWCPYCSRQIPNINQLEDTFGPEELTILAVDSKESRAKVVDYVKREGIRYRVLLDPEDRATNAYGVSGIPHLVLISREGNIAGTDHGVTDRLVSKIRALITSD